MHDYDGIKGGPPASMLVSLDLRSTLLQLQIVRASSAAR